MLNKLFEKIKKLENEIEEIKQKNAQISEQLKILCSECKIDKNKKNEFKTKLFKYLEALKINDTNASFKNGILNFSIFLELVSDMREVFLLTIDLANMDEMKKRFVYGYFVKKYNPIFSVKNDILFGIIKKEDLENVKKQNKLPFLNPQTQEFDEVELFKVIFISQKLDFHAFERIKNIFEDLRSRPSFRKKHFIVYSLDKGRVIDFEMEKILKEKEKYSYIYDETYPILEAKLKKEISNAAFVLALLERIDEEMEDIKSSRGIINVVNRILTYIDLHTREEEIKKMVESLKKYLKK
jgi:hypothetical protein